MADAKKPTDPKPHTPEQDAKDALAGRKAAEDKKAAENQALLDAGLVEAPAPITGYEHERAKLGTTADEQQDKPAEAAKAE